MVTRETLRADLLAGLVGALVVLPQGVAYATLAGLPPQFGLYCAMLPATAAALWGSSWHQVSGPTNAIALVVFATMSPLATPGTDTYIELVLTLALLVGLLQFGMGIARLGALVDFISHTVVVGFTAGAGLLIIAAPAQEFLRRANPVGRAFLRDAQSVRAPDRRRRPVDRGDGRRDARRRDRREASPAAVPVHGRRDDRRQPVRYALLATGMAKVPSSARCRRGSRPLSLPSFDPETWRTIFPAALALTVLGLTEAVSIARAVAAKSGQRIDGNQEFIGQGLSNIVGAFTSACPSSGSFNRSGINYEAGARTPLAAVFAAILLVAVLLAVAPLAAYLPLAVMAGLLFVVAWGLIDFAAMRRIFRASRGDALVLAVTFVSTLAIQLEFAIFVGVLASLLVYLNRTTHPHLTPIVPDRTSPQRRSVAVADVRGRRPDRVPAARAAARRRVALLRRRRARPRRAARRPRVRSGAAPHPADRSGASTSSTSPAPSSSCKKRNSPAKPAACSISAT